MLTLYARQHKVHANLRAHEICTTSCKILRSINEERVADTLRNVTGLYIPFMSYSMLRMLVCNGAVIGAVDVGRRNENSI